MLCLACSEILCANLLQKIVVHCKQSDCCAEEAEMVSCREL